VTQRKKPRNFAAKKEATDVELNIFDSLHGRKKRAKINKIGCPSSTHSSTITSAKNGIEKKVNTGAITGS
jgi:hypothetical protein